ncbi:MAG: ATP phosphoribosyltransferase [Candidatus Acididesulfobacter diazotrophicus]|uniref:ATP phosphoribosyltransferase n=1 Tax=Candidatus Acididesulfobacter diazotrophicus TaxID=2597226 RepID=A0A519BM00_9DELT|nr:MAG: ATP phosphoribosyltransferase [Candidatus Acididesulfobacter diazotrophicus]
MKEKVRIAIPKGRVLEDSLDLLRKSGFIKHPDEDYNSRKLIFNYEDDNAKLLIVKPWDVPTFVEYGAADIGIAGKDILLEKFKNVYEPLDLGIGRCKIAVAVHKSIDVNIKNVNINKETAHIGYAEDDDADEFLRKSQRDEKNKKTEIEINQNTAENIENIKNALYLLNNIRVATKYVNITKDFFKKKGISVQIVKLYGNIELAPLTGLCDVIVDLVSTGETLKQNNLLLIEEIAVITSRLIVNRASLKTNPKEIHNVIMRINQNI